MKLGPVLYLLLKHCMQCASNPDVFVCPRPCSNYPGIFGNRQNHYLDVIKQMLAQCIAEQEQFSVSLQNKILILMC